MESTQYQNMREVSNMAKAKKDSRCLNCNIDQEVYDLLEKYCNGVGQTKTLAVEQILKQFFTAFYKTKINERMHKKD